MMVSHQVIIWLGLNVVDLVLSIVALHYGGAEEILLLQWLLGRVPRTVEYHTASFIWYGVCKVGLAVLVVLLLYRINKPHLLKWLNIGVGVLCLYLAVMLIKTFS